MVTPSEFTQGEQDWAAKHRSRGRRQQSANSFSFDLDETGMGGRKVPLRNRRDGTTFWAKQEELEYFLDPWAKPLNPNNRDAGEPLYERVSLQEALNPIKTPPVRAVAVEDRPVDHGSKPNPRKRKRGRRGH